jgi:hypothetical protein
MESEDNKTESCTKFDDLENAIISMVTESWRFSRLFYRLVGKLDAGEGSRYVNQLRYFLKKLEENTSDAGMKLVNVEGQAFETGMAATPLNISDFSPDDQLMVDQMIEPIIMGTNGLKKEGTIMLRKVQL